MGSGSEESIPGIKEEIHPDPKAQFIVEVDVSKVGVGAILSQCSAGDSKVHPCAFYCHRLSPAEQNYDIGNIGTARRYTGAGGVATVVSGCSGPLPSM